MRKISLIIGFLLILLASAYSLLWFYKAKQLENIVSAELADFSDRLAKAYPGSKVSYSSIKIDGFPSLVNIHIAQPELLLELPDGQIYMKVMDKLNFSMKVFGNVFSADMAGNMISGSKKPGDDKAQELEISYQQYPKLEVVLGENWQSNRLFWRDYQDAVKNLNQLDFKSISYNDKGTQVVDRSTGNIVSSSDETSLNLNRRDDAGKNIYGMSLAFLGTKSTDSWLDILALRSGKNVDPKLAAIYKEFGKSTLVADASMAVAKDPHDMSGDAIDFKNIRFDSDFFNFSGNGNIHTEEGEPLPLGNVDIKISKYRNFVTLIAELYNSSIRSIIKDLSEQQKRQVKLLDDKNIAKFNEMINRLADMSSDGNDASFSIHRDKGSNLYVGKLTYPEVISLFQEGLQPQEEKPKLPANKKPKTPSSNG